MTIKINENKTNHYFLNLVDLLLLFGMIFPHNIFTIVNVMFILFPNLFLHKYIK